MLQKIAIKMLGDFSVVADGRCVVDATAKLTKPWQLFCYLALNREHVTPSSVLLQELWGGEELADPANVLKNTVYALRRELAGPVKPAESPILFRAGGYCLNGHIKWSVDTERFEQLCAAPAAAKQKWQPGAKRRERSGENCCPSWPVRCG